VTRFEGDWVGDPDDPSSRFTRRATIAFAPHEKLEHELHTQAGGDLEWARREAVRREIGDWILQPQADLGELELHDTSVGSGAALWGVVLEWVGQGVVGGLAWVATVAMARRLRQFIDRAQKESPDQLLVSAGTARYLAIAAVLDSYQESGCLGTQAIELPSTMGGRPPHVVAYSDELEPWIVSLVSQKAGFRYVVVVSAHGEVAGVTRAPLGYLEKHFGVQVEIPGEPE
jgi:hypothetical protein